MSRPLRTTTAIALAALGLATTAATAGAAVPGDAPTAPLTFEIATAENGVITDGQRTFALDGATADAGVPRCLGDASFARTAWAIVPAAPQTRRVTVEAAPQEGSTSVPDLAAFVQPAEGRSLDEPSACSGRETAGDGSRGDEAAAVSVVVGPGRDVLVQVGWRDGDAPAPVVAALSETALPTRDAPAGQDPGEAPRIRVGRGAAVPLRGALLMPGDPAQPRCQSHAGVWRRVTLPRKGGYALATAGGEASTITAFSGAPRGGNAIDCADDGTGEIIATAVKVKRRTTLWVRVGTDRPEVASRAGIAVQGPYRTLKAARAAQGAAHDRAMRVVDPKAGCIDARDPQPAIRASSLRTLRRGGRTLRGTSEGSACVDGRATTSRIVVAVARVERGRCRWLVGARYGKRTSCARPRGARRARGTTSWRMTLRRALPAGVRHRIVVRGQTRRAGRLRTTKPRATATVRRSRG
ncbi:MAG: hypothetical protein M0P31_10140 [Solirubrobacteraceae bacterium]|nr:hypothetical protein [Solirubrobacteraceae bacterium]